MYVFTASGPYFLVTSIFYLCFLRLLSLSPIAHLLSSFHSFCYCVVFFFVLMGYGFKNKTKQKQNKILLFFLEGFQEGVNVNVCWICHLYLEIHS